MTVDDGLPENTVRTIVQDRQGFLWLGTQAGLVRWDGYQMRTFLPDPADSSSIGGRIINALFLDQEGDLWIGSLANGVARYSTKNGTFRNWYPRSQGGDGVLPGAMVTGISQEADGSILVIFTDSTTIARIDPHSGAVSHIPQPPNLSTKFLTIMVSKDDNLWLGTSDQGVVILDPDGNVVQTLDEAQGLQDLVVGSLHEESDHRTWILGGQTLSLFDHNTGRATVYYPEGLARPRANLRFLEFSVAADKNIWIAADVGLYHFSPNSGQFTLHSHDPGRMDSLSKGPAMAVAQDQSGIVWVGTWHAGLNKYVPGNQKFTVYHSEPNLELPHLPIDAVSAVAVDSRRRLWVGTGTLSRTGPTGGLVFLAPGTRKFQDLPFPGAEVRSVLNIAESSPDSLWLGTNAGLWLCLPQERRIVRPPKLAADLDALLSETIRSLTLDHQGVLWIGTHRAGLFKMDPTTGQGRRFTHDPLDKTSLSMNTVTAILEDRGHRLWVGTDLGGLDLLDRDTGTFTHYYDAKLGLINVTDLLDNGRGGLWVATVSGLFEVHPDQGIVDYLGRQQGLPNDMVGSILIDAEGHLWLSTGLGLTEFDPETRRLRQFDTRDGLPTNEASFAHFQAPDGTLFFGGPHGLVNFNPRQTRESSRFQPQIVLTNLEVMDRFQDPVSGSELPANTLLDPELVLPWNFNHLAFEFAALDFSRPERIEYRFMLENHDHQWRQPGPDRRAEYTRLSPGEYRFRAQATNGDGIWSPLEATLDLKIRHPWWASPVALIGLALTVMVLVYWFVRQRLKLEKRKTDLRIRLAEARKIRELDQVKSRFFANISHEFRTPLTLIQGPLTLLEQDPTQGDPKMFTMMRRNAQRLNQLINQLLDLSRLENKRFPLNWQPLDVLGLMKVLSASFESLAESRGLKYRSRFTDQSGSGIGDPDLLEKVVVNLLANAVRFAPLGAEVWIEVKLGNTQLLTEKTRQAQPKDVREFRELTVEVGNTGTFIPEQEREKIFDRFYRAPNPGRGQRRGSGIGLALIRELVDLLAGNITLQSDPDTGTVFEVTLPLYTSSTPVPLDQEDASLDPVRRFHLVENQEPTVEHGDENATESCPLLLVVEDDPDLRAFLFDILNPDFRVLLTKDGEEGLDAAFAEVPDLIISDVMMPRRDGFQLCRALKKDQRTNHIPVILLTARAESTSRVQGLKTGADSYLAKPFEPKILQAQVQNLIEQRRRLQQHYSNTVFSVEATPEPPKSADEEFLLKAREVVSVFLDDSEFNVARFSREVGMSRSQLHRKLTALTGLSASAFIRSVRLHKAAELLGSGFGNVSEVALATGHLSLSNFSRNFKEQFGVSPSHYSTESSPPKAREGKA